MVPAMKASSPLIRSRVSAGSGAAGSVLLADAERKSARSKMRPSASALPVVSSKRKNEPCDPFGWTAERRGERAWRDAYFAFIDELCAALRAGPGAPDKAVWLKLAQLPESVRGYGHVKHAALVQARAEAARLRAMLGSGTRAAA
mgnify:CR=1 FL=1